MRTYIIIAYGIRSYNNTCMQVCVRATNNNTLAIYIAIYTSNYVPMYIVLPCKLVY